MKKNEEDLIWKKESNTTEESRMNAMKKKRKSVLRNKGRKNSMKERIKEKNSKKGQWKPQRENVETERNLQKYEWKKVINKKNNYY